VGVTRFILDSGDPDEYRSIAALTKQHGSELWGSTTNPSLIAKKLSDRKFTKEEAFHLQKQIIFEILDIVPGAVSAEVYADPKTTADEMATQGREIGSWHERVMVKLPTTIEGFKARTLLRKEKIPVNNTLVFSQEQIYAICLHEQLCQKEFGPIDNPFPSFISPFVGRLDDLGENGMQLVEQGMRIKKSVQTVLWMLEASIRRIEHIKRGFELNCELITVPAKVLQDWFAKTAEEKDSIDTAIYASLLKAPSVFTPADANTQIADLDTFHTVIQTQQLNIQHPLTDKGIIRFAEDWQAILSE
jgi:transaldolase